MRPQADADEDRAVGVTPPIRPTAPWRVKTVRPLSGRRLSVTFQDGLFGFVDMSELVASPKAGVFASLKDDALFDQVRLEHGAVAWPGELDLEPDAMHAAIAANDEWKISP
jgi:hypothetical protein